MLKVPMAVMVLMVLTEAMVLRENLVLVFREPTEPTEFLDRTALRENLVPMEGMEAQEMRDLRDPPDPLDLKEPREPLDLLDLKEIPESPDPLDLRENLVAMVAMELRENVDPRESPASRVLREYLVLMARW